MYASASKIDQALLCPASQLLPRNRREPGTSAKRGTMAHSLIIADVMGWERPDPGRYKIKYTVEPLIEKLGDGQYFGELALSYDPIHRAAAVLGQNIGREYPDDNGLHGTADLVCVPRPDWVPLYVVIIDIKTGIARSRAADSWQLKHNAVSIASVHGCDSVKAILAFLNRDGTWEFDEVTWGLFALEAIADDLAKYAKQARTTADLYESGWDPPMNPSETACRYCECECPSRYGMEAA